MAEPVHRSLLETRIQEFSRHLTCADPQCRSPNQLLEVPKMLPCLHRFCADCLSKQLERQRNNLNQPDHADAQRPMPAQYHCPLDHCKEPTGIHVHDQQLDLPRTDEFLEKMIELFKLEESLATGNRMCEICEPDEPRRAVRVCRHDHCWNTPRCESCARSHAREPAHRGHQFLHVEDLRRVPDESNIYACGLRLKPSEWYCDHDGEQPQKSYYCSVHDKVLCCQCGNDLLCGQHNQEYLTVEYLARNFPNHRTSVSEKLNGVKELRNRFGQSMEGIRTRMDDLERECRNKIEEINLRHQRIVNALHQQKENLEEKTRKIYGHKKERLVSHMTKVRDAHRILDEATDFIDGFLKIARDTEFYYEKTRISACLEMIGRRFDDNRYCITPQESQENTCTLHPGYDAPREERTIKKILGRVSGTPCVPFFKISNPSQFDRLTVGSQTTITVISRDVCENPLPGQPLPDLVAYFKVPNQELTFDCPVRKNQELGQYQITMQPSRQFPAAMRFHIFHKRPDPLDDETIQNCPVVGFPVVRPGIPV